MQSQVNLVEIQVLAATKLFPAPGGGKVRVRTMAYVYLEFSVSEIMFFSFGIYLNDLKTAQSLYILYPIDFCFLQGESTIFRIM